MPTRTPAALDLNPPRRSRLQRRVFRFAVVGALTTAAYFVMVWVVSGLLGANAVLGAALAFAFATLVSYVCNARWSFEAGLSHLSAVRYGSVAAIGFLVNLGVAAGAAWWGYGYWSASLAVLLILPAINFSASHLWIFPERLGRPSSAGGPEREPCRTP
jgi:putative flippase GtrA